MFCTNCGGQTDENAVACPHCGVATDNFKAPCGAAAANNDAPSAGFAVLCVFLPMLGLILYITWHDTMPKKARSCGKGAVIGAVIGTVVGVLFTVFFVLLNMFSFSYYILEVIYFIVYIIFCGSLV